MMHAAYRLSARLPLCLLLAACGGSNRGAADDVATGTAAGAPPVDSTTLSATAVAIAGLTLDTARTRPWQNAVVVPARLMMDPQALETIGSITEGRITQVLVRVGDRVSAGQILVAIHSHEIMDARSSLSRARAQVTATVAERDLAAAAADRAQRLLEAKAMSKAEYERAQVARTVARANHEQAVAEQERAAALVEHLVGPGPTPAGLDEHEVLIRTPINGVVTAREAQPGTVVLPGTPLVVVGNPERLQLQMHLTESGADGVRAGSVVRFAATESPADRREARVTRVAPTVDTLTRTIEVLAVPRGRAPGRAESFVQAEVLGRGTTSAIVVPSASVQAMEGDTVVFVGASRGAGVFIQAQRVRVGRRSRDLVEITAGLSAGTVVVVQGAAIAKAELLKRRSSGE